MAPGQIRQSTVPTPHPALLPRSASPGKGEARPPVFQFCRARRSAPDLKKDLLPQGQDFSRLDPEGRPFSPGKYGRGSRIVWQSTSPSGEAAAATKDLIELPANVNGTKAGR